MHEFIEVSELPERLHEIDAKLRAGERFVVARDGSPIAALVPLSDLDDLDETDVVLADQGLLEALRAARAVAGEQSSDYDP